MHPFHAMLAVFSLLLFIVLPVTWFGVHWAVGRLATPPRGLADSARIAALPLACALAIAAIAPTLQSIAWAVLRAAGRT